MKKEKSCTDVIVGEHVCEYYNKENKTCFSPHGVCLTDEELEKELMVMDSNFQKLVFDDVSEYTERNAENIEFTCEFCGVYTASKPRCNKCEREE